MSTWDVFGAHGRALVNPLLDDLAVLGWSITTAYFADGDDAPGPQQLRLRRRSRYAKPAELAAAARSWGPAVRRSPLVLARAFEAGLFAWLMTRAGGPPYVFHAEGFWIEERQAARSFAPPATALLARLEATVMRRAVGLVLLTSRAQQEMQQRLPSMPTLVVPSSIDMARFNGALDVRASQGQTEVVRCCWLGSFGGRYDHGAAIGFVRALSNLAPVELTVISADVPADVRLALESSGVPTRYESVDSDQVGALLATFSVGLLFLEGGAANRGTSPTKFPEYLAAGLPVALNPDLGDCDDVVKSDRIGVVVDPRDVTRAAQELLELLRDPLLARRCVDTARRRHDAREAAAALDRFLEARLEEVGRTTDNG
jgi:hypothetical protein